MESRKILSGRQSYNRFNVLIWQYVRKLYPVWHQVWVFSPTLCICQDNSNSGVSQYLSGVSGNCPLRFGVANSLLAMTISFLAVPRRISISDVHSMLINLFGLVWFQSNRLPTCGRLAYFSVIAVSATGGAQLHFRRFKIPGHFDKSLSCAHVI